MESSIASSGVINAIVPEYVLELMSEIDNHPWLFASIASMLVGLSGIFPLLVIPVDESATFKDGAGAATLRVLLSFAVGGLLGDVFLHLLPEAWENDLASSTDGHISMKCGLWVLFGMLVFIIVEKLFEQPKEDDPDEPEEEDLGVVEGRKTIANGTGPLNGHLEIEDIHSAITFERKNRAKYSKVTEGAAELPACGGDSAKEIFSTCLFNNNSTGEVETCSESACNGIIANGEGRGRCLKGNRWMGRCILREGKGIVTVDQGKSDTRTKHIAGYLNLMANSIDNFTHGLAVGGSFLVGFRTGILTTFAILVHEIPHEVGDFAILLKSGFTRWEAAKAQFATASAGLIGALFAVVFSGARNSIEAKTSWIAPFTAGGFLHIALVTVLPDLINENDKMESLKQIGALVSGITIMAFMTYYFG